MASEDRVAFAETAVMELLCARICHDLAGPIGAVAAGAELFADGDATDPEALELLASSAQAAMARIKFLRAAFGPRGAGDLPRLRETVAGFLDKGTTTSDGKLEVAWIGGEAWSTKNARLLFNMILLARDCVSLGGKIVIDLAEAPAVTAEGPKAALHQDARTVLALGEDPSSPRAVQAWFARSEAESLGYELVVESSMDRVSVGLRRL